MRAVIQDEYGETDVLRLEQVELPRIGDREVLVRVEAAGLDQGVWHLMSGLPYPVRLAGYGLRAPKTRVRGSDFAGRVEAVGDGVEGLSAGDDVFGIAEGSFAEYAPARADKLTRMPADLGFEQAAVVPVSGLAALQGLRDHGRLERGERVLIVGASGGVGTFAVQIAKALGARVTAVCSGAKAELVHSIGADEVIDYAERDFADDGGRYELILDIGGNSSLGRLRRALAERGRLVITGGESGGRWLGGTDRQLRAMLLSLFVRQKLGTFISSENAADLEVLREMIEAGDVTPVVDRSFALAEVPEAIRYMRAGRARGKVAIDV